MFTMFIVLFITSILEQILGESFLLSISSITNVSHDTDVIIWFICVINDINVIKNWIFHD